MKKVFILLIAILVGASLQVVKAQNANHPYVHCVILDKTMSMTGHGGTNIWADVQNYCYEWVDGVPLPSTVLLFTFDKGLYGPEKFEIKTNSDKDKIKDAVKNIKVDGRFTYISSNLGKALDYVYENYPKTSFNNRFYLITDGIEEEVGSDFAGVMKKYSGKRGDYDYLFYVDLRDLATDEIRESINNTPNSDIRPGMPSLFTMGPALPEINFYYDKTNSFEQDFVVSNGSVTPDMYFNVKIASTENKGEENGIANVAILPSKVKVEDMKKIEEGRYRMRFQLDFINNSQRNCDINVELEGVNEGENILTFAPEGFTIKARKTAKKVEFKPTGKTKTSTGKVKIKKSANKSK